MTSHGMLDQLLLMWREQYDALQEATAELKAQLEDVSAPFKESMAVLEQEIKDIGIERAASYKELPVVDMNYRKGYFRVSYASKQVDVVLAALKDLMPNMAIQLEAARTEKAIPPSVSIKAKEGK